MSGELRLTVGEIAFAVGVVSTIDRALEIVREQLEVADPERAKMALAVSGQSLRARELATLPDRDVRLVPALQSAAEIVAGAEWLLRCARVAGKRMQQVMFHLAPTGVLAQVVEDAVVHRITPVAGVGGLVDHAAGFFGLPPTDHADRPTRLDRQLLDDIAGLSGAREIGRELTARGIPEAVSRPFAGDLADPSWKGGVSIEHCPKGQAADRRTALLLIVGARRWLIDAQATDVAVLQEASRQRFGAAVKDILRGLDSTTRKLDRAGELEV